MTHFLPALAMAGDPGTDQSIWASMFDQQLPIGEKILRTVIVYAAIVVLLRIAGKRQLAQLNTFDLVVALLLSNVVQNAIIGNDNSVTGGLLGAVTLVGVNGVIDRLCYANPTMDRLFNGRDTTLILDGQLDQGGLDQVGLAKHELLSALHRQGADHVHEVKKASISPGGSITVELKKHEQNVNKGEFDAAVSELRELIDQRFAQLQAALQPTPDRPTAG